jgi:hypothetical protein
LPFRPPQTICSAGKPDTATIDGVYDLARLKDAGCKVE